MFAIPIMTFSFISDYETGASYFSDPYLGHDYHRNSFMPEEVTMGSAEREEPKNRK